MLMAYHGEKNTTARERLSAAVLSHIETLLMSMRCMALRCNCIQDSVELYTIMFISVTNKWSSNLTSAGARYNLRAGLGNPGEHRERLYC